MLIKIDNKTFSVRWQHTFIKKHKLELVIRDENGDIVMGDDGLPVLNVIHLTTPIAKSKRFTRCFISMGVGSDAQLLATGIAKCHKNDDYIKCKGRKESLQNALELLSVGPDEIFLDKQLRKAIWKKYTETTKCKFEVGEKKKKAVGEKAVRAYDHTELIN